MDNIEILNEENMKLFTIGHSTYDIEYFINVLKKYSISCIVDVRSTPYSKYTNQYNMDIIKNILRKNNINKINI